MIIDELIAVLGYDIRGEGNLNRFNAGLERTAALAQRAAALLVAAGTIAAGAMVGLGKSVIETSAKFEGFETSLETIEGSAEKAKAAMGWISQFAAQTPYELDGVTEAFIKLRAYGFDPMDGTLKTLGDTASAMNKPLNQAVEAFADAATFEFERLKEFGIKSEQKGNQVTFRWQQNGKEMTKVVKKNGKEVTKFLLDTFGGRFNNAMERQSKTWNGMISNLGDTWDDFKRRIGAAGFFEAAKSRLKGLLDYIGELDKDGSLDRWSKNISEALTSAADFGEGQIKGFIGDLKFLTGWIKANPDWWVPIKTGVVALAGLMFPKVFALLVLQDIIRWLQGKDSVIGNFAKSLTELTGIDPGTLGTILATLGGAGAAFLLFGGTFGKVAAGIRALAVAIGLMGAAQTAAGTTALTQLSSLGAIAGLLGIAAAAAAAATSIKAFYDAWSNDKDLNNAIKEKVAPSLFDFVVGKLLGQDFTPEQQEANRQYRDSYGPQMPKKKSKAQVRMEESLKKVNQPSDSSTPAYSADDWRMDEQRKETERVNRRDERAAAPERQKVTADKPVASSAAERFAQATDGMIAQVRSAVTSLGGAIAAKLRTVPDFIEANAPGVMPTSNQATAVAAAQTRRDAGGVRSTENLPGKTADDVGIGERVISALAKFSAMNAKMSDPAQVVPQINNTANNSFETKTTVNLTVQQIEKAASAAANSVKSAVESKLSNVPAPARRKAGAF